MRQGGSNPSTTIKFTNFAGVWDANTIKESNAPATRAVVTSLPWLAPTGTMQPFDITANVQDCVTNGNYGWRVDDAIDWIGSFTRVTYYSSENTTITSRPKLTVIYTTGTNVTVNAVVATSQSQATNPTISTSVNIISPSMASTVIAIVPIITSDCNVSVVVINTNSNALIPIITAENNYKKSPIYKWKELLQNYTFVEQKQKYKIKELPSIYSWKELK